MTLQEPLYEAPKSSAALSIQLPYRLSFVSAPSLILKRTEKSVSLCESLFLTAPRLLLKRTEKPARLLKQPESANLSSRLLTNITLHTVGQELIELNKTTGLALLHLCRFADYMFDHYKRESFRLPLVSHPPKHGKRVPKDPACTLTTRSQQTAPDNLSFLQRKLALIISFFCNV